MSAVAQCEECGSTKAAMVFHSPDRFVCRDQGGCLRRLKAKMVANCAQGRHAGYWKDPPKCMDCDAPYVESEP